MKTFRSAVSFYYYSYFYFTEKVRAICDARDRRSAEATL